MILNLTYQNKLGFLAEFLCILINFKRFLRDLRREKRFFQKLWDLLSDLNLNKHHRVGTEGNRSTYATKLKQNFYVGNITRKPMSKFKRTYCAIPGPWKY